MSAKRWRRWRGYGPCSPTTLRSPLTVMISYASTVGKGKAGNLSERQKEMLDLVVEQGFKMDADIVELVRIARETLDRYGYKP